MGYPRKSQTVTATPAKPGELSIWLELFAEMPALQIEMTRDARSARGWVHNEMFLSMSGRRRLTAVVRQHRLSRSVDTSGENDQFVPAGLNAFRERTDLHCARSEWIDDFASMAQVASDSQAWRPRAGSAHRHGKGPLRREP